MIILFQCNFSDRFFKFSFFYLDSSEIPFYSLIFVFINEWDWAFVQTSLIPSLLNFLSIFLIYFYWIMCLVWFIFRRPIFYFYFYVKKFCLLYSATRPEYFNPKFYLLQRSQFLCSLTFMTLNLLYLEFTLSPSMGKSFIYVSL